MPAMSALDRCINFGVNNIRGIAYMPGPSNYTKEKKAQYFDSDFYNGDFELLWGDRGYTGPYARGDLPAFMKNWAPILSIAMTGRPRYRRYIFATISFSLSNVPISG